jgi:hypothetical protein
LSSADGDWNIEDIAAKFSINPAKVQRFNQIDKNKKLIWPDIEQCRW